MEIIFELISFDCDFPRTHIVFPAESFRSEFNKHRLYNLYSNLFKAILIFFETFLVFRENASLEYLTELMNN